MTAADYATIIKVDPFTNANYAFTTTQSTPTSQSLTWTNTAGTSVTNSNTQTDGAMIYYPSCNGTVFCSPAYTGPLQWNVYQDNIYGSFEFQP